MNFSPFSTISDTTAAIRTRAISITELVETTLERIVTLDPKLRAFANLDAEGARAQARRADSAITRNDALGALHGVPVTIKGNIDVAGLRCPAGSLLRKDYVAQHDAPLVARLRAAGAIILGNTNTPEFLMAYESDNLLIGKTSNPWDLSRSAGGSSGGEAAAIASGCSFGGVGSDGGGSIRVPAHFSGICGLKPTPGRVPSTGHFPPGEGLLSWLGVVGPMARTIADVRALFQVLAGPDPGDALSAPVPLSNMNGSTRLKGLRVGLLESSALPKASPETEAAVQKAAALLADEGFSVELVSTLRTRSSPRPLVVFLRAGRRASVRSNGRRPRRTTQPDSPRVSRLRRARKPYYARLTLFRLRCSRQHPRRNPQAIAGRPHPALPGFHVPRISSRRRNVSPRLPALLSHIHAPFAVAEPCRLSRRLRSRRNFPGRFAHRSASDWTPARRRTSAGSCRTHRTSSRPVASPTA